MHSVNSRSLVAYVYVDNHMRTELEVMITALLICRENRLSVLIQTRMVHSKPYELLLPTKKISPATERMVKYFTE